MAGYTSTERKYGEYIKPLDIDFLSKAMLYKEQKVETNIAKLQDSLSKMMSIDVLKDVDRDYLTSRISTITDSIRNAGSMDLSDSGVFRNLDSQIQSAVDDNVLNAFQSTTQVREFQKYMKELQMKDPKSYNKLNETYAYIPLQHYMKSETAGDKLSNYGSLIYTPYVDVEGEINKMANDMLSGRKGGKYIVPLGDGSGRAVEKDANALTFEEAKDIARNMMGDKYAEQIKINAWGHYGGFSEKGRASFEQDVDKFIAGEKARTEAEIIRLEAMASDSAPGTAENKKNLLEGVDKMKTFLASLDNQGKSLKSDFVNGAMFLQKEAIASRVGTVMWQVHKGTPDSYVKDDVFFETQKVNLDQQKFELDKQRFANETRELDAKLSSGYFNKGGGSGGSGSGSGSGGGSGSGDSDFNAGLAVMNDATTVEEDVNLYANVQGYRTNAEDEYNRQLKSFWEYINRAEREGDEDAKIFMNKYRQMNKGSGKANGSLFYQLLQDPLYNKSFDVMSRLDGDGYSIATLKEARQMRDYYKDGVGKIDRLFNNSEAYKTLNEDFKNIHFTSLRGIANGELLKVLKNEGIVDAKGNVVKQVTSSENALKELRKVSAGYELAKLTSNGQTKDEALKKLVIAQFRDAFGIDISSAVADGRMWGYNIDLDKLPSNVRKYVGIYTDPNIMYALNALSYNQKSTSGNYTTIKERNEAILRIMPDMVTMKRVAMSPDHGDHSKVAMLIANRHVGLGGDRSDTIDSKGVTDISFSPAADKNSVTIHYKYKPSEKSGEEGAGLVKKDSIVVTKEELQRNLSEGTNKFITWEVGNFTKEASRLKTGKIESGVVSFKGSNMNPLRKAEYESYLTRRFSNFANAPLLQIGIHQDTARSYLTGLVAPNSPNARAFTSDISAALQNKQLSVQEANEMALTRLNKLKTAVTNVVQNANKYKVTAQFVTPEEYVMTLNDAKTGRVLYTTGRKPGTNLQQVQDMITVYSGGALTTILDEAIKSETTSLMAGSGSLSTGFINLFGNILE